MKFKLTHYLPPPKIVVDSQPMLSFYVRTENIVHASNWSALPAQFQAGISGWASLAENGTTGEKLFDDMFHRFFLAHELAHWAKISSRRSIGII